MTNAIRAIRERLCDGADLLLDFATLGEYGFEPVEAECRVPACAPAHAHGPVRLREAIRRYERAAA
jgi:hypothetical protein